MTSARGGRQKGQKVTFSIMDAIVDRGQKSIFVDVINEWPQAVLNPVRLWRSGILNFWGTGWLVRAVLVLFFWGI